MTEQPQPPPGGGSLFSHLVVSLATNALHQLGRVPDPLSGETGVNLPAAQSTIDVLDTLAVKTKGNLDKEEEQVLGEALTSLRMLYVQTAEQGGPAPAPAEAPAGEPPAQAAAGEAPAQPDITATGTTGEEDHESKVRYQKKYE